MKILNVIGSKFSEKARPILENIADTDYLDLTQKELETKIIDYDILVMQLRGLCVDKAVLNKVNKLKVIAVATTGLDHIDVEEAEKKGIKILSLKNETEFLQTITGTAELAFGLMIDLLRKTHQAFLSVKDYKWENENFRGHNLRGKTLGILGLGRLGKLMAKYAQAFQMEIIACDPYVEDAIFNQYSAKKVTFTDLLKQSDIISIHIHLTNETKNLFNINAFEKMKNSSCLINTSRGKIVNESDLLEALQNKKISGYATDVMADELQFKRVFSDHPLVEYAKKNNNLIIVPHIGGTTCESREATDIFISNKLKHYLEK